MHKHLQHFRASYAPSYLFRGAITTARGRSLSVTRQHGGTTAVAEAIEAAQVTASDPLDETDKRGSHMRGRTVSDETKAKIAAARRGCKHSDESRAKISAKRMGHRHPPEVVEKIRQGRLGQVHSAETRMKISAALKGRMRPRPSIAKMSATKAATAKKQADPAVMTGMQVDSLRSPSFAAEQQPAAPHQISMESFESMDAAMTELIELRTKINSWIRAFQAKHGRAPHEGELVQDAPELHDSFLRYAALLQFLREED
ncbi:hypothetical protein WJX73_002900 [Symbiochloris irregularis]|uniref:Nuclease associated modular domain-containing protein n=1 Tax=Symbiochloris irregularis TaxID=706552 RepID=A0AAW1PQL5_9CHLO